MQTSRLPFDIYLEIIDAVAVDRDRHLCRATLSACALTEQLWLPRARAHLYRKVVLHEDVEFLAFSKALLANSLLGPQVRELSMYISWQESAWCSWDNNPCIGLYDPFPLPAVRTLSNIRSAVYEHDGGEFV